jgi:hypothetical protein
MGGRKAPRTCRWNAGNGMGPSATSVGSPGATLADRYHLIQHGAARRSRATARLRRTARARRVRPRSSAVRHPPRHRPAGSEPAGWISSTLEADARGMEKKGPARRASAIPVEDLWQQYLDGQTLSQVAADHGVTSQALYKRFRAAGLIRRRFGRTAEPFTTAQMAEMVQRYEAGESCSLLSQQYHASDVTVARHLTLKGVEIRRTSRKLSHGRCVRPDGYVLVWLPEDDPFAVMRIANGYVLEHRIVMARSLGRPLLPFPGETVHHKDGNKANNRLENLELRQGSHGVGQVARCADCGSTDIRFAGLATS